jgi:hypothetical protein
LDIAGDKTRVRRNMTRSSIIGDAIHPSITSYHHKPIGPKIPVAKKERPDNRRVKSATVR